MHFSMCHLGAYASTFVQVLLLRNGLEELGLAVVTGLKYNLMDISLA